MPTLTYLEAPAQIKGLVASALLYLQCRYAMAGKEYFDPEVFGNRKESNEMSATQVEISDVLGELRQLAPAGYAIGLQIQYTTPKFMFQTYSKQWLDLYSQKGLLMSDPTLGWGFENTGATRWSKFADSDPAGVLTLAAEHGIKFGVTCAQETEGAQDGIRSIGSFSHNERDFTDQEVARLSKLFDVLHAATDGQAQLPDDTVAQLKKMSIMVTHPGS